MTVKEAISVLKHAKQIVLFYGDNAIPFSKDNPISVEAFGGYVVDEIQGCSDAYYEVTIATQPVKMGNV